MADLQDDRKKEEEEYGGFEPDENDDESFMLEDENEYPAKLPDDFSDVPSSPERVTTSSELDEDEPDAENEKQEQDEDSSEDIEEFADNDEIEDITPETNEIEEIEEPIADEIEPEEIAEDETLDLGDDFKKKLQADIEKSKAKREAQELAEAEENEANEPIDKVSAPTIGDDAETVLVLNDIEADKPSNVKTQDSEPEIQQPPITGNVPESREGEEDPLTVEEKDNKKTPIWILMLYSSVATFIITVGLAALIWYLMSGTTDEYDDNSQNSELLAERNHSSDEHKDSEDNSHAIAGKPDSISKEEMNWLDSMEMDKNDTSLAYKEDKEFFASLEDELDDEDLIPEKKTNKKTEPKKKESKSTTPKKENPKKETNDLATNDNTKSIVPKENKKNKTKIDESQFSMPQPKGPVPEVGTFTVQIYSSPSREDAESWLGQLKAQQIPYAMIAEQDIKGRTWYRVRYGKFETKEAARASALELGYSQSWIDRIK